MGLTVKFALRIILGVAALAAAVITEATVRTHSGGPMTIDGLPIPNASVTATWYPDFLWMGNAWRIEIISDRHLELTLDNRDYLIPGGSHTVYSNHDHTNTKHFGDQEFWDIRNRSISFRCPTSINSAVNSHPTLPLE